MKRHSPFRTWLEGQGYRRSTARTSDGELRLAERLRARGQDVRNHHGPTLRRYRAYLDAGGPASTEEFATWVRTNYKPAAPPKRKTQRQKPAVSYTTDDWKRLCLHLASDPRPEAHVLELQTATGLRVGDVLRLERDELQAAIEEGRPIRIEVKGGDTREIALSGAPDVWERLARDWTQGRTVMDWVSPRATEDGRGAYHKVWAYLQQLGEDLGLAGRSHTHRLRRTIAVRALKMTSNLVAVQHLLGHKSINSTQHYVDEPQVDEVAALQRQLRESE